MSFDVHHIRPKAWGGPDDKTNLITVCPTTHRNAHGVMDLFVKHKGNPPQKTLTTFPVFARNLALRGINAYREANGGAWPVKYTLDTAHHGDTVNVHEDLGDITPDD